MYSFEKATNDQHKLALYELNYEYLDWAIHELKKRYGIEIIPMDENYDDNLKKRSTDSATNGIEVQPPEGVYYIIYHQNKAIGIGRLKGIGARTGEIKRMFTKPEHQGKKLGKKLLDLLLQDARDFGFDTIRLDSALHMETAHHIYQKLGFREIEPYPESEIPDNLKNTGNLWN